MCSCILHFDKKIQHCFVPTSVWILSGERLSTAACTECMHGVLTLSDMPFQANFGQPGPTCHSRTQFAGDFMLELFPLRLLLLGESLLTSLPLVIIIFSRWHCLLYYKCVSIVCVTALPYPSTVEVHFQKPLCQC